MKWNNVVNSPFFHAYIKSCEDENGWQHVLIGTNGATSSKDINDNHIHVKQRGNGIWILCKVKENGSSLVMDRATLIKRVNQITGLNLKAR